MIVLGLDLSLVATGVVLAAGDELDPEAGLEVLHSQTVKASARRGIERLIWIAEQVERIRDTSVAPVDLVAIEGYAYGRPNQAHQLGELGGVIRLYLERAALTVVEIPPSTWRKQLLGKGSIRKEQVPLEMFKRYGIEQTSIDALEAYAVALAAFRSACGLDKPEPKSRKRR